ncbi:MAG: cation transporter [Alloprevotella sp.]|nr:cation transporter [Alloprevotella sp.]
METHHHHHHHHVEAPKSLNSVFVLCIVLNVLFVVVETGVGFYSHSLGLLSDAGHNLSDVFSLVLALVAIHLARLHSSETFSYGYKKSTILISLLNAIILLIAVGAIVIESIHKFITPEPVSGEMISWTAGVGIVINGLTAWLLMPRGNKDLNVRGAYLHMVADTLVSVGVVVSGVIIILTGWTYIDPIISLIIAIVILISTLHLLSESLRLSLDGTPEEIDPQVVRNTILNCEHILDVHHIHIWAISTTEVALTAHLVVDSLDEIERVKAEVKSSLLAAGIQHSTLELELPDAHCSDHDCDCLHTDHEHTSND